MAGYAIPVNTAATASDSTDWKSDMERIEAASKANPPLVWTQHDKSGAWRTIDLRPKNEIYQENAALTAGRNDDHDNVRRKSGNTHRRIRDPRRDRTGNESRRESGYDDDVRHNATRPNR